MNTSLLIKSFIFCSDVQSFFRLVYVVLPEDACDNGLPFVFLAGGVFCEDTFDDAASIVTETATDAVFFD